MGEGSTTKNVKSRISKLLRCSFSKHYIILLCRYKNIFPFNILKW